MKLEAPSRESSVVRCASFGDGCSFLVAAQSDGREAFGDVVDDPTAGSFEHEECPECGSELLGVEQSL